MSWDDDNDDEDDGIIEESPEYSPKSDFSKAEVVKLAVQKVFEVRAKEMKEGYWNTKLTKDGQPIRQWMPDTRKEYFSAYMALRCLLNPEVWRDDNFRQLELQVVKDIEKIKEKYLYEELKLSTIEDGKTYGGVMIYKKTGNKFMPPIGATLPIVDPSTGQVSLVKGGWDEQINNYYDEIIDMYDVLFMNLNSLIDSNNYFKQKLHYA